MRYLPLTTEEKNKILKLCNVSSFEELTDQVPNELRVKGLLDLDPALSELELIDHLGAIAAKNKASAMTSFLGQGVYDHFSPKVIDQITNRGEFLTAYTPYQPEISQGTLQVIFEYQSMIADLTGMDVSNASLYDGATSVVEAVLMAARLQNVAGPARVIVGEGIYDRYRLLLQSYLEPLGFTIETWKADAKTFACVADKSAIDGNDSLPIAAVVLQSPNTWGVVEDWTELKNMGAALSTKTVSVVTHAHSLALYESPGEAGIDIVCGEAQTLGIPVGFGGPHLGILACKKSDVRQMPGRLVGATVDAKGQQAFCVTLSTREQHIRREKATSNICSNQNLMALRSCIYMTLMGPDGMIEVANQSRSKAYYAAQSLKAALAKTSLGIQILESEHLNEICLLFPANRAMVVDEILARAEKNGFLAGVPVEPPKTGNFAAALVLAFTEKNKKDSIDRLIDIITRAEDLSADTGNGQEVKHD